MCQTALQVVTIAVDDAHGVSGLLRLPQQARECFVLARGVGIGMMRAFMSAVADGLNARAAATLRYQFSYVERSSRGPDAPSPAHATVRGAVAAAAWQTLTLALFAGGKSFAARMTSQAQAVSPLPDVCSIASLGFPLHPAGKPAVDRTQLLFKVPVLMFHLQGT